MKIPPLVSLPFLKHEIRTLLLNSGTVIFLCFGWAMASALAMGVGGFFAANRADATLFLGYMPWVFALMAPALAMTTWAEGWRNGQAERLFTLPIHPLAVVVTRFLVLWLVTEIFLLGTWPFVATLAWLGAPDWGQLVAGYIGAWLAGGALAAAALFVSAISRSYVVAFLGGFILCVFLLVSGWSTVLAWLAVYLPQWAINALQGVSLLDNYRPFLLGRVEVAGVAFFLLLIVMFITLTYVSVVGKFRQKHIGTRLGHVGMGVATVLVTLVLAGSAQLTGMHADFTASGQYTLSPATVNLIKDIKTKTTVTVYATTTNPDVPAESRQFLTQILDMLNDFSRLNANLTIVTANPDTNIAVEIQGVASGVTEQPLPTGEGYYLGIVADSGGHKATIPVMDPAREPFLEFDLASLFAETQKTRRKTIAILAGTSFTDPDNQPIFMNEIRNFYNIVYVRPGDAKVPTDADLLLVMPVPFLPVETLYAIDQYMVSGGRSMLMLDPFYRNAPADEPHAADRNADAFALDHPADLLRFYGVNYDGMLIVGDKSRAFPVQEKSLGFTTYPFWLALTADNVNTSLPFTSYVSRLLFGESGFLEPQKIQPNLGYEAVVTTSPNAQAVGRAMFETLAPQTLGLQLKGPKQPKQLAGMLHGKFTSMFNELPNEVKQYYDDYAQGGTAVYPPHVKGGEAPGVLVAFADMDFTADKFALDQQNGPDGEVRIVPKNDNLILFYNALQYLAGEGDLIGLRGKTIKPHTFTRIEAKLDDIAAKYVTIEQTLASELQTIKQRLAELRKRTGDAKQVDAELQTELTVNGAREMTLRKQLRELRRTFRTEIYRIQNVLMLLNVALMPLIAIGGYLAYRRRRAKRAAG